jgi:RNA polymerase sigma factor (sigma-70 family)
VALFHSISESTHAAAQAAAAVYEQYGDFIRAVIRFEAKNEFQEEELFQDFFLALVARPVPANISNIKGYIYRALVNLVAERARQRARERRYLKKHIERIRISIHKRSAPTAFMDEEEEESLFQHLAGKMRRREAEAVMLRYRDNHSIAEIAEKMGVDPRTVSHYISAGLRELRRVIAIE